MTAVEKGHADGEWKSVAFRVSEASEAMGCDGTGLGHQMDGSRVKPLGAWIQALGAG